MGQNWNIASSSQKSVCHTQSVWLVNITTGCPNINKAVACCFSSATALFFWDTLYSGSMLRLYITFVPVIRTSKHFWLLQYIWDQTMVIYPWCITTCSHWNHCIWSQELWEYKFLVFKNGLIFYRFVVEWVSFLHKMTIKGLIKFQMNQRPT